MPEKRILEVFGQIPEHDPLRLGTLISILRVVAQHKGVTRDAIIEML